MVENAGYLKPDQKKPLTDESPSISSFVDLHARRIYVSCIAKEWQPHVFDMKVIKCLKDCLSTILQGDHSCEYLVYRSIEFMSLEMIYSAGEKISKLKNARLYRQLLGM